MNIDKYIFKKLLVQKTNIKELDLISNPELISFITKYKELKVIEYNDGYISLTEEGKHYLLVNRKEILLKAKPREWREIPSKYLKETVETDCFVRVKL